MEPDRFVEFVDRLAADLAGPPVDTVALAARAHLSRSRFDRVIQALAGESPARFRNRVVLERAAYRMIVTDATLLDIAVAAGFSVKQEPARALRVPRVARRESPPFMAAEEVNSCLPRTASISTRRPPILCRPGRGWVAWS